MRTLLIGLNFTFFCSAPEFWTRRLVLRALSGVLRCVGILVLSSGEVHGTAAAKMPFQSFGGAWFFTMASLAAIVTKMLPSA